jgi:hypothetical protein
MIVFYYFIDMHVEIEGALKSVPALPGNLIIISRSVSTGGDLK